MTSTRQFLPRHEGRIAVIVTGGCEPCQEDPDIAKLGINCVLSGTLEPISVLLVARNHNATHLSFEFVVPQCPRHDDSTLPRPLSQHTKEVAFTTCTSLWEFIIAFFVFIAPFCFRIWSSKAWCMWSKVVCWDSFFQLRSPAIPREHRKRGCVHLLQFSASTSFG